MKALKIIYRILYILLGIGWVRTLIPEISNVVRAGGKFQAFDTLPVYGIKAYIQCIGICSFFYWFVAWIPLSIAVMLHTIYKNKIRRISAGDEFEKS
ncbi:MAG: hypothetical protein V3G42_05060 [Oscillospiraceae bacterium]